jgi:class 3 adenylate cyclase/tetratricopeptide (TPR) repeat protein
VSDLIRPYVPRPVIDWLRDEPDTAYRQVHGTLAFADISGFTTLTERLARRGKVGAEEMGDLLNSTFAQLLVPAYDYGAALIKWGGDAVLLLFDGDGHEARACRAAYEMQRTIRRAGHLRTSAGAVTLRMSVGVHSGALDFFLLGSHHRELIVTGPAATKTTLMEQVAQAGEVVVSPETAAAVGHAHTGPSKGLGLLLASVPDAELHPQRALDTRLPPALDSAVPEVIRQHVTSGLVESEHRFVTTGFVQFKGTDDLLATGGPPELAAALLEVVDIAAKAAARHEVTFLATDVAADGGKVILLAGAPRSHDRAEERMLCALREIMDTRTRLQLRAGATNGRAFTGDFGPHYRRTYSIVGDSVNLAARLMAHAEPGQLVVTPELLDRSHTHFEAEELPPFFVKGKSEPIHAKLVGGPKSSSVAAAEERAPLVGRDAEMAVLTHSLAEARAGRGSSLDVVGDAGLGKTRLVEELCELATTDTVHGVACDGFDAATPYGTWRRLLTELIRGGSSGTTVAEALVDTVEARCPQLSPWLPLLASVLGVDVPTTAEVAALDERFRRARLGRTVTTLLTAMLDTPTLLVFEDAHLMDDASAELLRAVRGVAVHRPWLVVATRRPARDVPQTGQDAALVLTPLDERATAALLENATEDEPLPPHELDRLRAHCGGNPLFLFELLAARRRLGDLDSLPDSLEGILASAIDDLDRVPRRVLRTASVLGSRFDRTVLDAVLATAELPCTDDVWRELDPFLVHDRGEISFRHALMREAAYQALPFRQRLELHSRAGEVIEQGPEGQQNDQLAAMSYHFFNAQRYEKAKEYSRLAGEQAAAQYANVEAALFFGRAVDAARLARCPLTEQSALAEALGDVWFRLGELTRAEKAFLEARRMVEQDPLARAQLGLRIAKVRTRAGRMPQALRWLSRGLHDLKDAQSAAEQELSSRLCAWYAKVRHEQGKQHDAIRWAQEAIARAEPVGAKAVLAEAYQHLDRASIALGRYDHAAEAQRALEIWEELGERTWQAAVLNHLGIRAYFQGDWPSALEQYQLAREVLERIGDQWNAAVAAMNIAEIYTDQGRLAEADGIARHALRVFRASETPSTVAVSDALLARIATCMGHYDQALEMFAAARSGFAEAGEHAYLAEAEARALECLCYRGDAAEALHGAEEMLAKADASGQVSIIPLLHRIRGWALAQTADLDGAQTAFQASLARARELDAKAEIALALDALVKLAEHLDDGSAPALVTERDMMFGTLGIEAVPCASLPERQVVQLPRQAVPLVGEPA